MIIATLLEPDLEHLTSAFQEFEDLADAFEVRFDAFHDRPSPERIRKATRKPLVATFRRAGDGGSYEGPEEARLATLEEAYRAGFDYVDLEVGHTLPIPDHRLIHSIHDFHATPPADDIVRRAHLVARNGGTFKFASQVQAFQDTMELLKATRTLRREGTHCAILGLGDHPRALGLLLGNHLVYAGARRNAPGQPSLQDLRATLRHWGDPSPHGSLYLIIGQPVEHSLSPRLHNAAFQADRKSVV